MTTRLGHRWSVWMMTPLRGNRHPFCLGHQRGGDLRLGDSSVPSQRSHGTTGSKADSGSRVTHRSTPTRSHPGDLDGKYGVQASPTDFEATPFGPNPPPGDPTLSTLSQDRSSRSGSNCPVDRPSSDLSDRSTSKGSTSDRSHRSLVTPVTGYWLHRSHRVQREHRSDRSNRVQRPLWVYRSYGNTGHHRSESSRGSGYSAPGPV